MLQTFHIFALYSILTLVKQFSGTKRNVKVSFCAHDSDASNDNHVPIRKKVSFLALKIFNM